MRVSLLFFLFTSILLALLFLHLYVWLCSVPLSSFCLLVPSFLDKGGPTLHTLSNPMKERYVRKQKMLMVIDGKSKLMDKLKAAH